MHGSQKGLSADEIWTWLLLRDVVIIVTAYLHFVSNHIMNVCMILHLFVYAVVSGTKKIFCFLVFIILYLSVVYVKLPSDISRNLAF
jgi:hypothetical protein